MGETRSLFYRKRFGDRFPVPALAFERVAACLSEAAEVTEGLFSQVLRECCGLKKPTQDDILYFAKRLEQAATEAADSVADPPTGPTQVAFGTQEAAWLKEKSLSELLLLACRFDFKAAEFLYTQVDREAAVEVLRLFLESRREDSRLQLEACLYGFGGGYAKEQSHDPRAGLFDLKNHTEGESLLRELF